MNKQGRYLQTTIFRYFECSDTKKIRVNFCFHYYNASTDIKDDNYQTDSRLHWEKEKRYWTHFCFNFPPFVVAQINKCNAQGKVTKSKETSSSSETKMYFLLCLKRQCINTLIPILSLFHAFKQRWALLIEFRYSDSCRNYWNLADQKRAIFTLFYIILHEFFTVLTTFWRISAKTHELLASMYCAVGVPAVLVLLLASLYYFWHAVAGGPAVTGFPAVEGVLAVASISRWSWCPYFSWWLSILDFRMRHINYRTIGLWLSDCNFFFHRTIRIANIVLANSRIYRTIGYRMKASI